MFANPVIGGSIGNPGCTVPKIQSNDNTGKLTFAQKRRTEPKHIRQCPCLEIHPWPVLLAFYICLTRKLPSSIKSQEPHDSCCRFPASGPAWQGGKVLLLLRCNWPSWPDMNRPTAHLERIVGQERKQSPDGAAEKLDRRRTLCQMLYTAMFCGNSLGSRLLRKVTRCPGG